MLDELAARHAKISIDFSLGLQLLDQGNDSEIRCKIFRCVASAIGSVHCDSKEEKRLKDRQASSRSSQMNGIISKLVDVLL